MTYAWIYVAAGGAVGAVSRYMVQQWALRLWGAGFPWGTLAVNVAGCLLAGLLAGAWSTPDNTGSAAGGAALRALLLTGFCGGFTTFSALNVEALELVRTQALLSAALYLGASAAAGLLAATVGFAAGRALAG